MLRSLRNRYMWIGEIVHTTVESALRAWSAGEIFNEARAIDTASERMRRGFLESRRGRYLEAPMAALGLIEHAQGHSVPDNAWVALHAHMRACTQQFFALGLVEQLRAIPGWRWLGIEASGTFELDGAVVFSKPDLVLRDEDGGLRITDWKTGKAGDFSFQLGVYALHAVRTWGSGQRPLRLDAVYLSTGNVERRELAAAALDSVQDEVRASISSMRALQGCPRDAFAMTDDIANCALCAFRTACGR
jgi:hypothetical protein